MDNEDYKKTDDYKAHEVYHRLPNGGITQELLEECYALGLIPKKDLKDGQRYLGTCRNAKEAVWNAEKERFTYLRHKFGSSFYEDIVHPEDDEGFDIFTPIKEIPPSET